MSFKSLVRQFDPTSKTAKFGGVVAKALDGGAAAFGAPPGATSGALAGVGAMNSKAPAPPKPANPSTAAAAVEKAKELATSTGGISVALVAVAILVAILVMGRKK